MTFGCAGTHILAAFVQAMRSCWVVGFCWWRQEIGACGAIACLALNFSCIHGRTHEILQGGLTTVLAGQGVDGSSLIFGRFSDQNERLSRAGSGAWPCPANACLFLWLQDSNPTHNHLTWIRRHGDVSLTRRRDFERCFDGVFYRVVSWHIAVKVRLCSCLCQ